MKNLTKVILNLTFGQHIQRYLMQTPPASDLMWKSCCFKFVLAATLGLVFSAMVLGIVSNSVTCKHNSYSSCSSYFYYSTNQCKEYGKAYCCGSYLDGNMFYSSCGGSSYCYLKPEQFNKCEGLSIVSTVFMGLSIISLFVVLISICHFRRKARSTELKPHYQPLVFSSQQEWQRYQYLNTFHAGQSLQANPNPQPLFPIRDPRGYNGQDKLGSNQNKIEAS